MLYLKRLSSILVLYCSEGLNTCRINVKRNIVVLTFFCYSKNVREMLNRNNIQPPFCHADILFYERQNCHYKGVSEAAINSLSSQIYLDTIKNTYVEHFQYTSDSAPENRLQMLEVDVNSTHKIPPWHFFRPYWRVRIQIALLLYAIIWNKQSHFKNVRE